VIKSMSSKCKALSSNTSTKKKKKKHLADSKQSCSGHSENDAWPVS
jgi:hypothetical protein